MNNVPVHYLYIVLSQHCHSLQWSVRLDTAYTQAAALCLDTVPLGTEHTPPSDHHSDMSPLGS